MPYYPIVSHLQPQGVTAFIAEPITIPVSYQPFEDLTYLTEQAEGNLVKIPGEDEVGTVSFYNQNQIPLPAVGSGFVVVAQLTVPIGYNGVIKKIENNLTGGGFVNGSGDVVWQILIDDVPIKNYDSILTERGDPNSPAGINSIAIYSGQTISYVVNHVSNPTLTGFTIAALVGYFFPQK
jgi:hypothetical protein